MDKVMKVKDMLYIVIFSILTIISYTQIERIKILEIKDDAQLTIDAHMLNLFDIYFKMLNKKQNRISMPKPVKEHIC
jgi:hypothetical protein